MSKKLKFAKVLVYDHIQQVERVRDILVAHTARTIKYFGR